MAEIEDPPQPTRPLVVVVSGAIASGKTTVTRGVTARLRDLGIETMRVPEMDPELLKTQEIDIGGDGKSKWLFQTKVTLSKAESWKKAYDACPEVLIVDQGFVSNWAFIMYNLLLGVYEWGVASTLVELTEASMAYVSAVDVNLWLGVDRDAVIDRVRTRGRAAEQEYTDAQLNRLVNCYEASEALRCGEENEAQFTLRPLGPDQQLDSAMFCILASYLKKNEARLAPEDCTRLVEYLQRTLADNDFPVTGPEARRDVLGTVAKFEEEAEEENFHCVSGIYRAFRVRDAYTRAGRHEMVLLPPSKPADVEELMKMNTERKAKKRVKKRKNKRRKAGKL